MEQHLNEAEPPFVQLSFSDPGAISHVPSQVFVTVCQAKGRNWLILIKINPSQERKTI